MQSTQRQIIRTDSECLEQDVNRRIRITHVHTSAVWYVYPKHGEHIHKTGKWEILINLRLKIEMKLVLAQLSPF